MPTTMKDVAKFANVSPSTVSRVIANNPRISDKTKEKVYQAMKELNYKPNQIARSLANKSTKTLGLLLPNTAEDMFQNAFFGLAMKGISNYVRFQNYFIMYSICNNQKEEIDVLLEFIQSKRVDGMILTTVRHNDKCIEFLKKEECPFVVIGTPDQGLEDLLWVDNDNFQAMYKVVKTLIQYGNRRIAFFGGKKEFTVTQHRLKGYYSAIKEYNIDIKSELVYETDYSEQKSYEKAMEVVRVHDIDAIVTTDDIIAFGVQQALFKSGMNHISVVGFNNTVLSKYKKPALATVDIHAEELGYNAARILVESIEKEDGCKNSMTVGTDLIIRESIITK